MKLLITSNKDDVYIELRNQIDKMPIGMPATKSGVEIRLLKHMFTPEEAKIALNLNILPEPLKRIYKRVKKINPAVTLEGLKEVLDRLAVKGAILLDEKKGQRLYSYAPFAVGMYEFQVGRLTKDFYEDSEEYFAGEFHKEFYPSIPQMRVVPVGKSISVENYVSNYDEMRSMVNNTEGQFGVMDCLCKQGKDLFGHKCQTTDLRETCILFPAVTTSIARLGGPFRAISKDETLKLFQQFEKEGLVIQPSNSQAPTIVCNCCGDCCAVLRMAKMYPKPAALFATNYYAEVDNQSCSGCGVCLKRCQMEALTITNKKSSINLDRCIGCGLCVSTCPKKAIKLVKKEKTIVPPKTDEALQMKILSKKVGKAKFLKIGLKKVAGQKI